jgi:hypothetical protein
VERVEVLMLTYTDQPYETMWKHVGFLSHESNASKPRENAHGQNSAERGLQRPPRRFKCPQKKTIFGSFSMD